MCDWSLEEALRRNARKGDVLRTKRLGDHGTVGLTTPGDERVAVCLAPGAALELSGLSETFMKSFAVGPDIRAIFAQRCLDPTRPFRDGITFQTVEGERFVLMQDLEEGIGVRVLTDAELDLDVDHAVSTKARTLTPAAA